MIHIPTYFSLEELVCEDVYNTYGKQAFSFFDPRLLITIDVIRERLCKPIYVNDWMIHGSQSQSGLRCPKCSLVKEKTDKGILYMSAHCTGQAIDFHVPDMLADDVRRWLVDKQNLLPYPIRLESSVNWIHCDVRDNFEGKKVIFFNA